MRIALVTMWGERYREIAEITVPVMKEYCIYHNYDFWEHKIENDNHYNYKKHEYFERILKTDCDVIFYLDVDCLISNPEFNVEDFVDYEHGLFVTKDPNGVNLGVLILNNTEQGELLNSFILSVRDDFITEQDVVNALVSGGDANIKVLEHPSINSYPYEYYPEYPNMKHEDGNWEPLDFICHVPGKSIPERIEILNKIKNVVATHISCH